MMIVLMQTDLPLLVVPAIRQWGICVRSVISGSPLASLPRNSGMTILFIASGASCNSSLNRTFSFSWFGTSIPTVFFPGTGATMRMLSALRLRMMSLVSDVIVDTFSPGARLSSYIVMTGPVSISTTWASTLNSRRACSSTAAFSRTNASWLSANPCSASARKSQCGSVYSPNSFGGGGATCRGLIWFGSLTTIPGRCTGGSPSPGSGASAGVTSATDISGRSPFGST